MKKELVLSVLQKYARHFPLEKGKRRVIKRAAPLWKGVDTKVTTLRFNNLKMRCDLSQFIQRELFFFGAYEVDECRLWIDKARHASCIFDVGANVGLYSLLAASENVRATIHAFEPTPILSDAIDTNVRLNGLSNVINNRLAVGDTNGEVYLNFCAGTDGSNEGMNFVTNSKVQDNNVATQAVTLDEYCRTHAIDTIDLMKMDVEGGEYAVLMGARELLKNQVIKCIFLELIEWAAQRSGHSIQDVRQLLIENGYKIYALQGGKQALFELGVEYEGNVIAMVGK